MKSQNKIFIAFILNLCFAIFEFVGGVMTNSVAIMSDAIHDVGDALSIGVSYFLERKSKEAANDHYTYGYARYSVIGGAFTTLVLIIGSCIALYNAATRLVSPEEIDYNGMIVFAIVGVAVNAVAAVATKSGNSINQKAVNLHMLEDVAGWVAVLVGAIVIKFTNLNIIDPILSIVIAVWILISACRTLLKAIALLSEKSTTPASKVIDIVQSIDGVINVHHLHVWALDEKNNCATMHLIVNANHAEIKKKVRMALRDAGIDHVTLELESKWECCDNKQCEIEVNTHLGCACHNH